MKKIMTIMASLATTLFAFGALGDVSAPPAGFEGSASGSVFDPSVTEGESTYWYAATVDDTNIITNYADSGESVPELVTGVVRPDGMKENDAYPSNSNFLSLETSTPLFRSVQANSQDGTFTGSTIGDGIYLDTLVKFTASEEEFKDGALEANVDKIAIEYVDQTNDETIENPIKAFVIRAGYVGSDSLFQTNYYAYLTDDKTFQNFDVNAWHRLTVRTIANIGGNNVGFIVYLDQKPLAYDEDCGDNFSPSTDAQNYYNDEIHAVYPSAVAANINGGDQIAAVAFSGNGSIDDVVFTTETPEFITASESVVVPFVADAGVKAISVSVAGRDDPFPVVNGAATLPAQTANFTVNVTVDEANGYTLGGISYNGDPVVNGEVTGYTGGDITITTTRNNFNLFDAEGNAITTGAPFQTLSDALAAQNVAKIVLAHSYNVAENEGNEFVTYNIDSDITLDLNGNTITGGGDDALFTVGSGVTMIVIDSLAANTGKIDYTGTYAVFYSEGDVVIGATTDDYGPTIDGYLAAAEDEGDGIWLVKAKIEAATNSGAGEFLWGGYLGDPDSTITSGADLDSDEEYWVVTPQGGSEPTEIAVPTAKTDLVYDGTEKIGVVVGTGYTLTGNIATNAGNYTATATLEAGYVWSDTTTEAKSINWSIAVNAGATVDLTLESEIAEYTELLDFPAVTAKVGTEDVTGEPVWDPAAISEPEAGATNTYTVTFTVMNGGYTGSKGTATFKVWKAESEEPVYPSYIDNITDPEKKAAYEAKYSTWATTYSVADGAGNEEAFLLNCAPANVETAKANFKIPSITVDAQGNVTVGTIDGTFNGKLQLKGSTDLSTWTNLNAASKDYNFFKYELTY